MTFKIVVDNPEIIKRIFEGVESIVTETVINFTKDGMRITNIDGGRVALIDLFLSSEDFSEYKLKEGSENSEIGLSLSDLRKILGRSTKQDKLTMFHKEGTTDLIIQMERNDGKKRKFTLRLKDVSMPPIKPEQLEAISYNNSFEIDCSVFIDAIKDCDIYSETMSIIVKENVFKISAFSNVGELETEIPADHELLRNYKFSEEANCTYANVHIDNAMKMYGLPNVSMAKIYTKQDNPIKIEYNILGKSFVKYYIAPRIDEFEEEQY